MCVCVGGGGDGHYFREIATFGGSLLSGFTGSHKKLALISGVATFRGVVTIGTLR